VPHDHAPVDRDRTDLVASGAGGRARPRRRNRAHRTTRRRPLARTGAAARGRDPFRPRGSGTGVRRHPRVLSRSRFLARCGAAGIPRQPDPDAGETDRLTSGHGAVALLVLQAAAAGARGVAWRLVADHLVRVAGLHALRGLAGARGTCRDVIPVLLHALDARALRLLLLANQLDAVDVLHEVLADRCGQRLEHRERLALVLDERIALGVRPQVDALL